MNDSWARRVWDRKGFSGFLLWVLLLPISFLYFLGIRIREWLYALGWMRVKGLPCAVVSVGNLTVGGTGKTPTTLWLAQELEKLGCRVAILSRGYRKTGNEPMVLEPGFKESLPSREGEDPLAAGDEPLMMARVFGQKVGVGRKRYEVASQILRDQQVDVFLLDDGFQHRQLKRDLDVLLLGVDWRGWLLPAGPFREAQSALRRADLYLITGAREKWEAILRRYPERPVFYGSLQPKGLLAFEGDQSKEYPLALMARSKILMVSAIANPAPLYRVVHDWEGEIVESLEFPDHHPYTARDWQRINRSARNADLIITTEKDIVKLLRFPFAKEKLLALRVEMVVEDGKALLQAVERAIRARREGAEAL